MIRYFIIAFVGAGLLACSSAKITVDSESITIVEQSGQPNAIDSLVAPYKEDLEAEMNEVIAKAEQDFIKGRPSATLNNWAADAIFYSQIREAELNAPAFCLLNVGGLRNTINKGDVTLGDMFKVMPFDNEIIWVEMPISSLSDIEAYLVAKGGEPIANAKMKGGKLLVHGVDDKTEKFWVITSDYLMNGGDKMNFFQDRLSEKRTDILVRDAMIEEAKMQEILIWNDENRIEL